METASLKKGKCMQERQNLSETGEHTKETESKRQRENEGGRC